MTLLKKIILAMVVMLGIATVAPPVRADVLCVRRHGIVVLRDACHDRETQIDPASVGLQPVVPCLTQTGTDLRFDGCNVRIVNGIGASTVPTGDSCYGDGDCTVGQCSGGTPIRGQCLVASPYRCADFPGCNVYGHLGQCDAAGFCAYPAELFPCTSDADCSDGCKIIEGPGLGQCVAGNGLGNVVIGYESVPGDGTLSHSVSISGVLH